MIKEKWRLNISPQEAATLLDQKMDAECIAAYVLSGEEKSEESPCCVVRVYERWYGLCGTTATLTVTLDDLLGVTRVDFTAGSGTRMPRGRMDWGVRNEFETMAKKVLMSHRVMG